jgi:hypothetical protein
LADRACESAQVYSIDGQRELEHRGQLLRELNRPDLNSFGQTSTGLSVQSPTASPSIHYHHLYPQQFREFFSGLGIEIDQWVVAVDSKTHLNFIHQEAGWNSTWNSWITEHGDDATQDEALRFGRQLLTRHGLEGLWEGGANSAPSYEVHDD